MKITYVIEVETTNEDLDLDEAASDLKTFRDALEDGTLLEAAARNLPSGTSYPELKSLKVGVKHEIGGASEEEEEQEKPEPKTGADND